MRKNDFPTTSPFSNKILNDGFIIQEILETFLI